jgi:hypothetical protein
LDEQNEDFGAWREDEGEDRITVGVRFVENVLAKVDEINV